MKIQIISDIHLELQKIKYLAPKAKYLFLAGDIGKINTDGFDDFMNYCSKNWRTVYYVLGNHEYYGRKDIDELNTEYRRYFNNFNNIYLLIDEYVNLGNYIIFGSTLWSNIKNISSSYGINDFIHIKHGGGNLRIEKFNSMNMDAINELNKVIDIAQMDEKELIVLTHFPPIRENTSAPRYKNSINSEYFSNNLQIDNDIIKLWISGHTHYSYDFTINNTRFVSNQHGYNNENSLFDIDKVFHL